MVDFYSYAYAEDPIVAGIIPESGNAFGWALPSSPERSAGLWFNTTATLGCGDASTAPSEILSCMRTKNASSILAAFPTFSGTNGILGGYGPTADGVRVFADTQSRTPAKIPTLIGSTNYEAGLFRVQFALRGQYLPDAAWDAVNLQAFTCPTGARANASIKADIPTWRYRYFGDFPNLRISAQSGAYHVSEIPVLFNTAPSQPPATAEQISIGKYMRGAWAAFAKNPSTGLDAYGWPRYDPTQDTLIRLAYDNVTGTNLINPRRYDADCSLININSTDDSVIPVLPNAGASITPTGTGGATPSQTGGAGGSPASTTTPKPANAGGRVEVGVWVVMLSVLMTLLL